MSDFLSGRSLQYTGARESASGSISLIPRAIDSIIARMREARTRRELMELDDHMLKDIGLSRIELNRINWAAKGHPSGM
jgi:uncharacterized protein YjiS (DUF1127 family)